MITLGEKVLLSRRDLALTQAQLAEQVGVSRSHIANIETGRITNVGIDVLKALAHALEVSPAYLMGFTDNPLADIDDEEEPIHLSEARTHYNADPTMKELLGLIDGMTPAQRQQMAGIARLLLGGPTIIE